LTDLLANVNNFYQGKNIYGSSIESFKESLANEIQLSKKQNELYNELSRNKLNLNKEMYPIL